MKTFWILGLASLGVLVVGADNVTAQRGGAARGGMRGAVVGGMVGGQDAARAGAVIGATRSVVNQEAQARVQYQATPAYQTAPRSNFTTAPPQVLATTTPATAAPPAAAATSGGEAVLRKDGKPMVAITYPADWKQTPQEQLVSAVSPDGQAWAGLALLQGAADKQAGINKVKEGLANHLSDIQYDEITETKNGALVVTGSGKGKKAGVDVVFAAGVFEAGKGQLAGAAFVADSRIEDHYKETVKSICETIRTSEALAK
jgi:hypothetical protein